MLNVICINSWIIKNRHWCSMAHGWLIGVPGLISKLNQNFCTEAPDSCLVWFAIGRSTLSGFLWSSGFLWAKKLSKDMMKLCFLVCEARSLWRDNCVLHVLPKQPWKWGNLSAKHINTEKNHCIFFAHFSSYNMQYLLLINKQLKRLLLLAFHAILSIKQEESLLQHQ